MAKTKKNEIKCEITSEWSDGSIVTTPCIYNPKTGEITPEVSKGRIPTGSLEEEYITLPDGELKNVCQVCHGFVIKTNPGQAKHDLVEEEVCSDPTCSDEE
jgi:hypothetical protein